MSGEFGLISGDRPNFESTFLISQQKALRLRHLSQIAATNLKDLNKCKKVKENKLQKDPTDLIPDKYGYYFTLAIKENVILYTSEFVNDVSPFWKSFDLDDLLSSTLSAKGCIVRIWFRDEESHDTIVLSWAVHFSGMVPIGKNLLNISQHVAPNTILFRIKEMLYTSPECRFNTELGEGGRSVVPMYRMISLPAADVKTGASVSSTCRLQSLKRSKFILAQRISDLEKDIDKFVVSSNPNRAKLLQKVEKSGLKMTTLTDRLESEFSNLREINVAQEKSDEEIQEKSMHIFDKYHDFNRDLDSFQKDEELVGDRIAKFDEVVAQVRERRIHLLRQLPIIFPITRDPVHKDKMYICNVHLPEAENYGNAKDSHLNVGFGYAAQLLVAISNLLNIPLAFPITFFGSMTFITDWTTVQAPLKNRFPLHSRGREKILFNYAVFLLNKNIAQLRLTCGLTTPDLRPTLLNISTLLDALCSTESRAVMPDVAMKAPLRPLSLDSILGGATVSTSDKDMPSSKLSSWLSDGRCAYFRKYENWKASYRFDIFTKSVNIERSYSLASGLSMLQKREASPLLSRDSVRRVMSHPNLNDIREQFYVDEELQKALHISMQKPAFIDGLNDSDRKVIDESFELVKEKYFLKRSSSLDRLAKLSITVNLSPRKSSSDREDAECLNDTQLSNGGSGSHSPSKEEATDALEEPPEEPVSDEISVNKKQPPAVDPLLEVCSRTSALAKQNFSFKFSNKRSDTS